METERQDSASFRELRLEGIGLAMVGGVLLAMMVGSFYAGRWFERRDGGSSARQARDGPSEAAPTAAGEALKPTVFDEVRGSGKQAEPKREVPRIREASAEPQTPPPPPAAAREPAAGAFFVQVFAGRDRAAAESLIQKLRGEGYEGRLLAEREGQGELLRVRVVGYATEEEARAAAQKLQGLGYSTWVKRGE